MGEDSRKCRRGLLVAGALVLVVALVGCASQAQDSPPLRRLYSPVNGSFGVGLAGVKPGALITQGDIPVCVDLPGVVTISGVEPLANTNAMSVTDFAVRSIPAGSSPLGASVGDLRSLGMGHVPSSGVTPGLPPER